MSWLPTTALRLLVASLVAALLLMLHVRLARSMRPAGAAYQLAGWVIPAFAAVVEWRRGHRVAPAMYGLLIAAYVALRLGPGAP